MEVLKRILGKLKELGGEEIALRKYIRQLSVLARLRNLVKETQRQVTDMGLLYDITKDYLYRKGLAKGRKEGLKQGLAQGKEEAKRELIASALATREFSTEQIAGYARVTVAYVEAIARELKK